jgi:outer membrane protein
VLSGFLTLSISTLAAMAEEGQGPFMIGVRLLRVVPDDSSSDITTIGGNARVADSITGDLNFTYFLTKHFATELTLAVAKNDVTAVGTAVGDLDLGHVYLLPPTLTAQYHFLPDGTFRPYVGAGINYTIFFNEDAGDANAVNYDNGFGYALQVGFDVAINKHWALNFDLKKIWLSTDVSVRALGTTVHTDVDIDPWLLGAGVAYRF